MITLQFGRTAGLIVTPFVGPPVVVNPLGAAPGGVELQINLHVEKTVSLEPQRATVEVTNLGRVTRGAIMSAVSRPREAGQPAIKIDQRITRGTHVQVLGGYASLGTPVQLFAGNLSSAINLRQGTDWTTRLELGDSEVGLTQAQCDRDFPPGTTALAILAYAFSTMGVSLGPVPVPAGLASYTLSRGWSAYGRSVDVIESLLVGLAPDLSQLNVAAQIAVGLYQLGQELAGHAPLLKPMEAYVDDGLAYIVLRSKPLPFPPLLVSSVGTPGGVRLLNRPERTDGTGLRLRMFLAPQIRLGQALQLTSVEASGLYRVQSLEHDMDNRGGDATTVCYVLPVA